MISGNTGVKYAKNFTDLAEKFFLLRMRGKGGFCERERNRIIISLDIHDVI